MHRRNFIKQSCIACLGITAGSTFLAACTAMKQTTGKLTQDGMLISLKDFMNKKDGSFRSYIVVRNEELQYPICVFRNNESDYTALYMRCSHQGAELQAAGDRLTCPAHGSEFDRKGNAQQGPAEMALRSFPTSISGEELFINLKKQ